MNIVANAKRKNNKGADNTGGEKVNTTKNIAFDLVIIYVYKWREVKRKVTISKSLSMIAGTIEHPCSWQGKTQQYS